MKRFSKYSHMMIAALCAVATIGTTARADSGAAPMPVSAPAVGNTTRVATGNRINVRSRPSIKAEVFAQINKGQQIEVLEIKQVTEGSKTREWLRIELPKDTQCFISAKFVDQGVVSGDAVNVRCGPGLNFKTIGQLNKGDQVVVQQTKGEWVQIDPPSSCSGWVASEFFEVVPMIPPAPPMITQNVQPPPPAPPEIIVETRTVEVPVEVPVEVLVQWVVKDGIFKKVLNEQNPLAPFELATQSIGGRQYRIAYLDVQGVDPNKFEGKHVRVLGSERWRKGDRFPVIIVERLEMVW